MCDGDEASVLLNEGSQLAAYCSFEGASDVLNAHLVPETHVLAQKDLVNRDVQPGASGLDGQTLR